MIAKIFQIFSNSGISDTYATECLILTTRKSCYTFLIHRADVVAVKGLICCCKSFLLYRAAADFLFFSSFPLSPFPFQFIYFHPFAVVRGDTWWAVVAAWVCTINTVEHNSYIQISLDCSFLHLFKTVKLEQHEGLHCYLMSGLLKDNESEWEWLELFSEATGSSCLMWLLETSLWKLVREQHNLYLVWTLH